MLNTKRRVQQERSFLALPLLLYSFACSAPSESPPSPEGSPTGGTAGNGGATTPNGGSSSGATGGMPGVVGGMGGTGATAGSVSAGTGGTDLPGVPPSEITLSAIAANQTLGLEWPRVAGATSYRLYFATAPGVTPATGQALESTDPTYVHRGLTNGTPYYYVVTAVTAEGESAPSNEVTATPGGEWALEVLGSGDFDDVLTGNRVPRLPIEDRVHVLLFPEGYLPEEMSIFHDHAEHNLEDPENDVDRWIREVFALDPYSKFREAFVIWFIPRASDAHIGEGETAFGDSNEGASAPMWEALDDQGPDAFLFPPEPSSRNYTASFLLFDPGRNPPPGRAGVSGHATTCRNPNDNDLSMRCAFGIGHAHEFTHVFSNVRDEYLEDNNSRTGVSDPWSNINGTNSCDELPWAHLLPGRGINNVEGLVGAFGRPGLGYRSELGCHMNGTHENGKYYCEVEQSLTLRPSRFCNFCRELTTYNVFYRTGLLEGNNEEAFEAWATEYRAPFFERFGFSVPETVPQTVECDGEDEKEVYEACVP